MQGEEVKFNGGLKFGNYGFFYRPRPYLSQYFSFLHAEPLFFANDHSRRYSLIQHTTFLLY